MKMWSQSCRHKRTGYLRDRLLLALEERVSSRKWWWHVVSTQSLHSSLLYTAGSPPCNTTDLHWHPRGPARRIDWWEGPQPCPGEKEDTLFEAGGPWYPSWDSGEWLVPNAMWDWRRNRRRKTNSPKAKCRKANQYDCLLVCEQQSYKKNLPALQSTLCKLSPRPRYSLNIKLSTGSVGPIFIRTCLYVTPSQGRMILPPATGQVQMDGQEILRAQEFFFEKEAHRQPVFQK